MLHKKIRIPYESSHEIMEELGKLNDSIQFVDINIRNFYKKNKFENYIERCNKCIKEIKNFEKIIILYGLNLIKYNSYNTFKIDLQNEKDNIRLNKDINYFDLIESEINNDKKILEELITNYQNISEVVNILIEKKYVYDKVYNLIKLNSIENNNYKKINILSGKEKPESLINNDSLLEQYSLNDINIITGIIKSKDNLKFIQMIFRISKGKLYPIFYDIEIENKFLKILEHKKIFIIFNSINNAYLIQKIFNICEIFDANRFIIPKNKDDLVKNIIILQQEIFDKKTSLKNVEKNIIEFFKEKIGEDGVPGKYDKYKIYFKQEKLIYENLNKCILQNDYLDGEIWIPLNKLKQIESILNNKININNLILNDFIVNETDNKYNNKPPTYFKLNDFSKPFQSIVNEYGIPRYREINPGLFTIVTFPFLFGVMFGDIGHGILLFLLGLLLIIKKYEILKNYQNLKFFIKYRYFILLLGFFTIYTGIIYNDFFAIPLNFLGSCYDNEKTDEGKIIINQKKDCVYIIGLDPKWHSANNELIFLNSFKMKISIIIGIIQMISGLCFKGLNCIYLQEYIEFFCVFIPQFIFMFTVYGYLILMIYIKWTTDWSTDINKAPSIILQFLTIFFNLESINTNQEKIQIYIFNITIICIFIMILLKPIFIFFKNKNNNNKNFLELLIIQIFEVIEFILTSILHTASYLRLWALSLAHGELSKIFFDLILGDNIRDGNIFGMFFGFIILFHVTLFILMGIDLIECLLHTVRLHWIEFQSKFYHADGNLFIPISFENIFNELN